MTDIFVEHEGDNALRVLIIYTIIKGEFQDEKNK